MCQTGLFGDTGLKEMIIGVIYDKIMKPVNDVDLSDAGVARSGLLLSMSR
jgi:hypothetical protein